MKNLLIASILFFIYLEAFADEKQRQIEYEAINLVVKKGDEISNKEKNYMVQHTAFYYIFDDNDVLRSILPFGSSIEQMVEDLKNL